MPEIIQKYFMRPENGGRSTGGKRSCREYAETGLGIIAMAVLYITTIYFPAATNIELIIHLNNDYTVLVSHARWFDNHYSVDGMQNVTINGRNMIMVSEENSKKEFTGTRFSFCIK
jgi:hypothetical protein